MSFKRKPTSSSGPPSKYSIALADSDDSESEDDVKVEIKAKPIAGEGKGTKLTAIQQAHKEKLSGSRFRVLNEELYTTTSEER